MLSHAAILSGFVITLLLSYRLFPTPTRFLLQTFILIPILFITSIICTLSGVIIKYLPFNFMSKAQQIFILQEIYKSYGEVQWFEFEFWNNLRYVISYNNGNTITLDDVSDLNVILMGNHSASLFDFIPLGSICDKLNRVSKSFVFIKKVLFWYPIMGWVEWIAPHGVGLSRNWNKDKLTIAKLCEKFKSNTDYKLVTPWIWFTFPEGTRFTKKKLMDSQKFARERGFAVYNHVLQPRVKGFSYLTHHLHESLGCIVDATILYKPSPPTPKDVFVYTRLAKYIHIHLRIYKQEEIPKEINKLDGWIRDRWTEKDEILKDMKGGNIPFKTFERSPSRGIKYYMFYAILSKYLVINTFCGFNIWSIVDMIMLICVLFPIVVVFKEHSQKMQFGKET